MVTYNSTAEVVLIKLIIPTIAFTNTGTNNTNIEECVERGKLRLLKMTCFVNFAF